MTTALSEAEWLHLSQSQVKPRLRTALIRLDGRLSRKGQYFTSIVDEQPKGASEVAFRVGQVGAQHEIRLRYTGGGRVSVAAGPAQLSEHSIDALDQVTIDRIASDWLTQLGLW